MTLILNGSGLTINDVVAVARHHKNVALAPEAVERITICRNMLEKKIAAHEIMYGVNTGIGESCPLYRRIMIECAVLFRGPPHIKLIGRLYFIPFHQNLIVAGGNRRRQCHRRKRHCPLNIRPVILC